jgi:hypothetical protein
MRRMVEPKNIVFASCDRKYFLEHGEAFVTSAYMNGETPHIHIQSEKREDVRELEKKITEKFPSFRLHYFDYRSRYDRAESRSCFAIGRFIFGQQLHHNNLLILDIDSFIRKPINWSDFSKIDYSLFFRDPLPGTIGWEKEGTHVAAGAVYVSHRSRLLEITMNEINIHPSLPWFVDQRALHRAHLRLKDEENYCQMPKTYIDWEFSPDSIIWTGKGQRKKSEVYLNEKSTYFST